MEEKVIGILEQMQNEIKDIKANMATIDDIRRIEGALFRFENKVESKLNALFDGYIQNTEAINGLRKDVESLKATVEQHEVKLKKVR